MFSAYFDPILVLIFKIKIYDCHGYLADELAERKALLTIEPSDFKLYSFWEHFAPVNFMLHTENM